MPAVPVTRFIRNQTALGSAVQKPQGKNRDNRKVYTSGAQQFLAPQRVGFDALVFGLPPACLLRG